MHASWIRLRMKLLHLFDFQKQWHKLQFKMLIASSTKPHIQEIHRQILIASKSRMTGINYTFPCENPTIEELNFQNILVYQVYEKMEKKGYQLEVHRSSKHCNLRTPYYDRLTISWK